MDTRSKYSKHIVALIFIILFAGLLFAPFIPTSLFIRYGNIDFRHFPEEVNAMDRAEILAIVRKEAYLDRPEADTPKYISPLTYWRDYNKFGILDANLVEPYKCEKPRQHCISVRTGFLCGGFCGGGMIFFLTKRDNRWCIVGTGGWVN